MKAIIEGLLLENTKLRAKLKDQDNTLKKLEMQYHTVNVEMNNMREDASKSRLDLCTSRLDLELKQLFFMIIPCAI